MRPNQSAAMTVRRLVPFLIVLAGAAAVAQVPATCDAQRPADKYQLLRRLSLDLRGRVPTAAEYAALDAVPSIPQATLDAMYTGEEFRLAQRRVHEELFWPNMSNVLLSANAAYLGATNIDTGAADTSPTDGGRTLVYLRTGITLTYRGGFFTQNTSAQWGLECGDFEQTQFDPAYPGQYRPLPAAVRTYDEPLVDGGVRVHKQEGWRWVQPYWLPAGQRVRVCAFDAQETPSVTVGATTIVCDGATNNAACGCGPNLRSCHGVPADWRTPLSEDFREQLERAVDKVTVGARPYTDLVLSTRAEINGRISHFKRWQAQGQAFTRTYTKLDPREADGGFPLLPATAADTWTEYDRGGLHAGVLTLPIYLLRFQTNRARGNRFQLDFECEGFEPPSQVEPEGATLYGTQGCVVDTTDLTRKCTCRYCHQRLEPLAAGWGQFTEAGMSFMDVTEFTRVDPTCLTTGSATGLRRQLCNRFYVTDPDEPNAGALLSYQYAVNSTAATEAVHKQIFDAFQGGPRRRAQTIVANKTFARCTAKRFFTYLLKREPRLAGPTSELALVNSLADQFITSGYRLPTLLQRITALPEYRSLR